MAQGHAPTLQFIKKPFVVSVPHPIVTQSSSNHHEKRSTSCKIPSMRYAIISDIHGNLPALKAVLDDIKQAGVDELICLGDIANIGPHPSECLDLIRDLGCVTVQGNHELYMLGDVLPAEWTTCPTWSPVRWSIAQLRQEHLEFMGNLPFKYELPNDGLAPAIFTHASLHDQFWGFYGEQSEEDVEIGMNGHNNITLFCAHTHRQLYRLWSNSVIVNVGSVGMPLDGTPEAKYVIATRQKSSWNVEFRRLTYNVDLVMQAFDQVGLQEAGGVITAVFRHQILTGQSNASDYLHALRVYAAEQNSTVSDVYAHAPIPDYVRPFLNGHAPKTL